MLGELLHFCYSGRKSFLCCVRWDISVDIILILAAAQWLILFKLHLLGQSIRKYFADGNSSRSGVRKWGTSGVDYTDKNVFF